MNLREWALPVYTILMQIAAGILLMLWVIRLQGQSKLGKEKMSQMLDTPITIVFFTIVSAIIGAHFHLSKPYLSLLAILNFRTSWLSREIIFTILFFLSAGSLWILHSKRIGHEKLISILGWLSILFGWVNIYCMARIYLLPTQVAWNSPLTIMYYFGTTLLLGAIATAAILIMDLRFAEVRISETTEHRVYLVQRSLLWFSILASMMVVLIFFINFYQISNLQFAGEPALTSLNLLLGLYQPLLGLRLGLAVIGVAWFIYSLIQMRQNRRTAQELLVPIYASCLLVMIGEILGRFLFYATHVRIGI